jgi:hypothetical protein
MTEKYCNSGKQVTREEFEKEREKIIAKRLEEAENEENLIDDEDLDFYLDELQKMEE